MTPPPNPARPLDGLVGIELCSVLSGPWAGQLLSELGMDVIKVEPPGGDISRSMGPWRHGVSALFLTVNQGKRSVCVDLKTAAGREFVRRMATRADVLIENWRPGVAAKLGLDPASLREENPRLVTVALRGYAEDGPRAGDRVYDPVIQAITGLAHLQGDGNQPRLVRTYLADKLGSLAAVQGALAALVARSSSGVGTHVEASMYEATLAFLWPDMLRALAFSDVVDEEDAMPAATPAGLVEAAHGEWLTYSVLSATEWAGLCEIVGRPEWAAEYADIDRRRQDWAHLERAIADALRNTDRDRALESLAAAGVASAPVLHPAEVLADRQATSRNVTGEGGLQGVDGRFRWMGPFVRLGGSRSPRVGVGPPALGEHTVAVASSLGYAVDEIAAMLDAGAIRQSGEPGPVTP